MARSTAYVAHVDFRRSDPPAWMVATLETLPVAVGLVDRFGRFVARSGVLEGILGDTIPSRSSRLAERWTVTDEDGASVDPNHWPAARALRGETVLPGQAATYATHSGEPARAVRIIAAPYADPNNIARAVVLIQDLDAERRARDDLRDHLDPRFATTLIDAVQTAARPAETAVPDAADHIAALPIVLPTVVAGLTPREDQVLKLLAWGVSQKEVSARLGVSVKTVDFHRARAARKLNLRTRMDLIRYAARRDWFLVEP